MPHPPASPIVLALDTPSVGTALAWARAAGDGIGMVKVGYELFYAEGPDAVRALRADGHRVMLDLKLHDIPATVAKGVRSLAGLGVELLTVHAAGGEAMLRAAVQAAGDTLTITAVTVLTSLHDDDLAAVGLGPAREVAARLARLAAAAGCPGLVCSPLEVAALRRIVGPGVRIVCPGVRPAAGRVRGASEGSPDDGGEAGRSAVDGDDQARVATPAETLRAGADLLVVGRPITRAPDLAAAARAVHAEAVTAA